MGMSRDAMGEMLLKQETQNMTAEEVRKKFGEQTYEQFKAMDASEKMQEGMAKLKDIFANIMTAFTPIIDGFAFLITPIGWIGQMLAKLNEWTGGWSSKLLGVVIIAKMLGKNMLSMFNPKSYAGFFSGLKNKFTGIGDRVKDLKGKVTEKLTGGASAGAAGATNAAGSAGATPAPKDKGETLREKMKNIAEGLKAFADPQVLLGGLYMIASAPGLIALGLASLPLKITEKINGKAIRSALSGIADGVAKFANPQVALGGLALIPVALGLAVMTAGAIGLAAIALLGVPASIGLAALTGGLTTLGAAAATGIPFLGVALVAAFGASLIPFGMALGMAAPAIEAVGTVIATVIMAIADAVVTVMPALTQSLIDLSNNINLAGLLGLAMAFPALAFGIGLLGGALLLSAPGLIIGSFTLPLIGPAITQLGESLAGIDTAAFFQFGIGMAALTAAFALAGLAYPLIIGGSLALSLALIPLTAILALAAPVIEIFSNSIATLSEIDVTSLFGLALALPSLAMGLIPIALMSPMIAFAALTLMGLGMALMPLSLASEGLDVTSNSLLKIAEAIQLLDIGRIATLSVAVGGLTASLLGLMALGPLALGAIAVMGGGAAVGTGAGASISPKGGGGGGTSVSNEGGGPNEDMRAMIEETVTATINTLVPEMVGALKEGIGNITVSNNNFNNSKQSEGPSRNRNVTNNNFA
jgi:hypothetical protein